MIRTFIISIAICFITATGGFAMHPYSKIAIDLKKSGYPQALKKYDNLYLPTSDEYVTFIEKVPNEEFVLVPSPVSLMTELSREKYTITHVPLSADVGDEKWVLKRGFMSIEDGSLWVVLAQFWLYKHGGDQ